MDPVLLRGSAERNFDDLDTDGDGFLTKDDYLALARHRIRRAGARPDSPEGEKVVAAFLDTWDVHVHALDADHDGRISREEYVESFQALVRTGALDGVLNPMFRATFDLADHDGDGELTAAEFRTLWNRDDGLSAAFQRADADGDGRISFEEYARLRRGLLVGEL
ncbi:EF-hand domain-containing protein [Nonomuraea sp. NPDC050227]|uniref:EF-hand domain-containing protein n=1 Tax=unclassified Nonomuraea TaxID=2593643 RepID=UPI0036B342FE